MNKVYRIVWSNARQAYTVASEHAVAHGKTANTVKRVAGVVVGAVMAQSVLAAPAPGALPTGGQVVAGQAAITQSGNAMTIQQGSNKAIINWNSFNVGSQASVKFQQPSSSAVALNRVTGSDPSAIYGSLSANGQVFLVNPNGVLFAPGAQVNVGGLIASTLNIRDKDFLDGNNRFTRDGTSAGVINQGSINAKYVAMLAPEVRNDGVIEANMGTVAMAAGDAVTLNLTGNQLIDVQVDKASINTLVENRHLVKADGGKVIMSARSADQLLGQVVNSGAIEAQGIVNDGGTVRLLASSSVNDSGSINVDAGANGKGGTASLISDLSNSASQTVISGSISAQGGSQSGDGGFVETSGTHLAITDSASVRTGASNGQSGQWLLDPYDFTIAASGGDMTGAALATALGAGNVTIQTSSGSVSCTGATCGSGTSSGNGDIFVNDTVSWSAANTLTLNAWRNIDINSAISVPAGGGLALKYAQSNTTANTPAGDYFVDAPVNLTATSTFTTQKATDGTLINYTVLTDQTGLQGMTLEDTTVHYVLGNNVTASGSWTPIGGATDPTNINSPNYGFRGTFDGLGHVVNKINISSTTLEYLGMFGNIGPSGLVQNIGITNASVTGTRYVGALAGDNQGTVNHVYSTGTVTGTTATSTAITAIGGLVGQNDGIIQRSRSSATVTGTNDTAGNTYNGGGIDGGIGGLVGIQMAGSTTDSYATGAVSGIQDVGGLIGYADGSGTLNTSYAAGSVTLASGGHNAGGLIGATTPGLTGAGNFWDTTTSGQSTSAGTIATGMTTANMQTAANFTSATTANGNANPNWNTAFWTLSNGSYPSLTFSAATASINITLAYVNTSRTYGDTSAPSLSAGSWTITSGSLESGDSLGAGSWGSALTSYLDAGTYYYDTTANLLTPSLNLATGHSLSDYTITLAHNSLTVNKRALSATVSKTYDGTTGLGNGTVTLSNLAGNQTLTYSGLTLSSAHVATANKTATLTLGDGTNGGKASNYVLPTANTTVTINPKALTMSGLTVPASKVYDGTTLAVVGGTPVLLAAEAVGSGTAGDGKPFSGDVVNFTGTATGTYNSQDVATAKTVTFGGLKLDNSDYALTMQGNAAATITPKPVTLSPPAALTKTYDGSTAYTGDINYASLTSALGVTGDSVTGITLTYKTPDAGTGIQVSASNADITRNGVDIGGNYKVKYGTTNDGVIRKPLTAADIVVYLLDHGNEQKSDATKQIDDYLAEDEVKNFESYKSCLGMACLTANLEGVVASYVMYFQTVSADTLSSTSYDSYYRAFNGLLSEFHVAPVTKDAFTFFSNIAILRNKIKSSQ
ncbi:two-partner secretion domain-containing protein [Mangrovitalea sediminis]|uniref:two-partner secretion domain-containing protein n=1 Tax=Mangrovitalea sediminis TaxID=1982043 RepID=UPI000BE51790|nr:filamentous hemagglutinin N-terminal domain-containing protein [Mangrovitalea sediminis]